MKMTMVKYILPIILALTAPVAAQEKDACRTSEATRQAASGFGAVSVAGPLSAGDNLSLEIFKHEDHYDVVIYQGGCILGVRENQSEADIRPLMRNAHD